MQVTAQWTDPQGKDRRVTGEFDLSSIRMQREFEREFAVPATVLDDAEQMLVSYFHWMAWWVARNSDAGGVPRAYDGRPGCWIDSTTGFPAFDHSPVHSGDGDDEAGQSPPPEDDDDV